MAETFVATVVRGDGKDTLGIVVPPEIVTALGHGRRPPVTATIGGYSWRSTVAVMGGEFLLGIAKEHRGPAGITDQTELEVTLALDLAPRVTPVPDDLAEALAAAGVRAAFDGQAPSQQREDVRNVEGAKKAETRARRIARIVERLEG